MHLLSPNFSNNGSHRRSIGHTLELLFDGTILAFDEWTMVVWTWAADYV